MDPRSTPENWFPAKRYGWGWGLPIAWQGWLVLAAFAGLVILAAIVFPPARAPAPFFVTVTGAVLALVGVCWWKGDPPRWRWGGD